MTSENKTNLDDQHKMTTPPSRKIFSIPSAPFKKTSEYHSENPYTDLQPKKLTHIFTNNSHRSDYKSRLSHLAQRYRSPR